MSAADWIVAHAIDLRARWRELQDIAAETGADMLDEADYDDWCERMYREEVRRAEVG